MFIKEIEIENYKSIRHLKLTNLSNINIFYGENNVGKSNILGALNIVFDTFRAWITRRNLFNFINRTYIYNCDTNKEIKIRIIMDLNKLQTKKIIDFCVSQEISVPMNLQKQIGLFEFEIELKYNIREQENHSDTKADITILRLESLNIMKDGVLLNTRKDRNTINLINHQSFTDLFSEFQNDFKMIQWYRNVFPEYLKLPSQLYKIDEEPITSLIFHLNTHKYLEKHEIFELINSDFKKLTNSGELLPSLDAYTEQNGKKDIVEVYVRDKSKMIPLLSMGSSAQQILAMITAFKYFNKSVIGLEEPEIHLSPRTQRQFFKYLCEYYSKENNRQIFLTTHSPLFISKGNLFEVKYHDETKETMIIEKPNQEQQESHFALITNSLTSTCFGKEYDENSEKCKDCTLNIKPDCRIATSEYNQSFPR